MIAIHRYAHLTRFLNRYRIFKIIVIIVYKLILDILRFKELVELKGKSYETLDK